MSCHVQISRTLTSLHVEVLSQILMHIENSDIPAVMLTCKTLCSAIMTRHFWYHRIRRLCKEHLVSPPEEKLEEYTIAELERWTLRRLPVRCTFPTKLQCRSRDLESIHTPCYMELIPGGRWLLLPLRDSRVYFVDLDSKDLQQHLLFDPRNVDPQFNRYSRLRSEIWIDHKAPRLSFRCAICLLGGGNYDRGSSRIQIHQVDLVGHGADATLVAQIIATFRTPERTSVTSCGFNDRYLVHSRKCSYNGEIDEEIEAYDYRPALGCLDYPQIKCYCKACPLGDISMGVEFINEDVFGVRGWANYYVFNIESPTSTIRLHTIDSYKVQCDHSRTRWTPEASIITRVDELVYERVMIIHGIVIPHNRALNPWSIELCKLRRKSLTDIGLGMLISMTCDKTNDITRIGHKWDFTSQNSNPTHVSILEHEVDKPQQFVAFDEDTGRFVHSGGKKLNIVGIVMAG